MSQKNVADTDVLILCGGQGTRFREVREDIPKAMAPINGVSILDLLLKDLVVQGCRRIILGTGYLSEQIEAHLKKRFDAEYLISKDEPPLGTGGAIRNALPLIVSEHVLVLNGDSYITFTVKTLIDFHKYHQADATILLSSIIHGKDYGYVELGENYHINSFQEKSNDFNGRLINAGVYCLQKKLIQQQPKGNASLELDWFPQWLSNKRVLGMEVLETFYDIGTVDRYNFAQRFINN